MLGTFVDATVRARSWGELLVDEDWQAVCLAFIKASTERNWKSCTASL